MYRLVRDDDGVVQRVYSRTAKQEVESRTLYSDSVDDEDSVYSLANDDTVKRPRFKAQFEWDGGVNDDWDFAVKCGCLPIVRYQTPTGKGGSSRR